MAHRFDQLGGEPMAFERFTNEKYLTIVSWTMMPAAFIVARWSIHFLWCPIDDKRYRDKVPWLTVFWYVGPALWFMFENLVLVKAEDAENRKNRIARFKLTQDAAKPKFLGESRGVNYLSPKRNIARSLSSAHGRV